jgi:hypothetical protein
MGYMREFNSEDYMVPEFLLQDKWEDTSWHNDACPSFENHDLKLRVWVAEIDPDLREIDEWKQFAVSSLLINGDEATTDQDLFSTDDQQVLKRWLILYETKMYLQDSIDILQTLQEPMENVMDQLVTSLAEIVSTMSSL